MSNVDAGASTSAQTVSIVPPPPRLSGNYQADQVVLSDYLWDFYNGVTTGPTSIDPNNLPDPATATLASAQLVANLAYQFAMSINAALGDAGITGFPLTPPTS